MWEGSESTWEEEEKGISGREMGSVMIIQGPPSHMFYIPAVKLVLLCVTEGSPMPRLVPVCVLMPRWVGVCVVIPRWMFMWSCVGGWVCLLIPKWVSLYFGVVFVAESGR